MGILERFRMTRRSTHEASSSGAPKISAHLHQGTEDLEVVGEASYQDALWALSGHRLGDRVRCDVIAVLVPQPQNPYDANAISVQIEGRLVGHLARDVAVRYGPGLQNLMTRCAGHVALRGVIVGGGYYGDGPGRLGVWLEHDPEAFGIEPPPRRSGRSTTRIVSSAGTMRTGFSEAWLTDLEDDSYDLSWFNRLPDADRPAIAMLRQLLASDPDPIDRHFQFAELETRLYRSRDLDEDALDQYDTACRLHDAEMEGICEAFRKKWGKVPLLETYRQMAVRQQKQKDWKACVWWTERGLQLYGNDAAREEAVEDLLKRRNRAIAKLETTTPLQRASSHVTVTVGLATDSPAIPTLIRGEIEILNCSRCHASFERMRVRGRKPLLCPTCRTAPV
jgi:hypothetical protein